MTPQQEYAQGILDDLARAGIIMVILLIVLLIGSMIYSHFAAKDEASQNEPVEESNKEKGETNS